MYPLMGSCLIEIRDVRIEDTLELLLLQDQQVVQAFLKNHIIMCPMSGEQSTGTVRALFELFFGPDAQVASTGFSLFLSSGDESRVKALEVRNEHVVCSKSTEKAYHLPRRSL